MDQGDEDGRENYQTGNAVLLGFEPNHQLVVVTPRETGMGVKYGNFTCSEISSGEDSEWYLLNYRT